MFGKKKLASSSGVVLNTGYSARKRENEDIKARWDREYHTLCQSAQPKAVRK